MDCLNIACLCMRGKLNDSKEAIGRFKINSCDWERMNPEKGLDLLTAGTETSGQIWTKAD